MTPDPETAPAAEGARLNELGLTAASVAHDFNNALTIILGSASMLRLMGGLTPAQTLELDALEGAARHGTEMVRQLLAHARRIPLRAGPGDWNKVAAQMGWMLRHIGRRPIAVDFLLAPGLGQVEASEIRLEQILLNLVVNAAAALPDGGQVIIETSNVEVPNADERVRTRLRPGSYVRLSVSDNGLGMSEDVQRRLFQPFYTTKKNGGGLGLFSVRRAARDHGGDVFVTSWLGVGTTFEVYLPRRAA